MTLQQNLHSGLEAMGLTINESTEQALIQYLELIKHWNKTYNLTAVRELEDMVPRHLLDSLSILPFIGPGTVLDVGSGAGLPGIPLALVLPDNRFTLVDKSGKKCRFMTQAKIELGLENIEVVNKRIEDYQPGIYFDLVIARAYAGTDDILKNTAHLHKPETRILVMQGKLDTTINSPEYVLKQSHTLEINTLDAERHLLEIGPQH